MKKKAGGFTVLELIIVLAITSVILGVLYMFFFTSNKTLMTTDINSTLQGEGEVIEKELIFCGTQAKQLLEINSIDIQGTDILYTDSAIGAVTKKLRIKDTGNGDIKFFVEGDTDNMKYTFKLDGRKLSLVATKVVGATETEVSNKVLSENVESFNIRPIDINIASPTGAIKSFKNAPGLEFVIILEKEKGYSKVSYPISTIVKFRNK